MCSRLDEPRSRPYPLQPKTDMGGTRFVQPGAVDDYKTIVDRIGVFWGAFLRLLLKIFSDFRPELHRIQEAAHTTKLRDNVNPSIADHPALLFPLTLITGNVHQLIEWQKSITSPLGNYRIASVLYRGSSILSKHLHFSETSNLANPFDWSVAVVFAALDKFDHLKLYYGL
ncbi:hypothetical protein IWQ60_007267 [Tieghemiomyces parasiticus]|uniref:Uncharacterized protein n=1 Tax=Tieghemiomyces parasiticus TaxID=78921 RepID=A0A9W8DPN5_9FUNG|nr:hypothetical protein IWQ60_007267 [Tieghemiomyces parasiticus]